MHSSLYNGIFLAKFDKTQCTYTSRSKSGYFRIFKNYFKIYTIEFSEKCGVNSYIRTPNSEIILVEKNKLVKKKNRRTPRSTKTIHDTQIPIKIVLSHPYYRATFYSNNLMSSVNIVNKYHFLKDRVIRTPITIFLNIILKSSQSRTNDNSMCSFQF